MRSSQKWSQKKLTLNGHLLPTNLRDKINQYLKFGGHTQHLPAFPGSRQLLQILANFVSNLGWNQPNRVSSTVMILFLIISGIWMVDWLGSFFFGGWLGSSNAGNWVPMLGGWAPAAPLHGTPGNGLWNGKEQKKFKDYFQPEVPTRIFFMVQYNADTWIWNIK